MSTKLPVSYYKVVSATTPAAGAEFVITAPGQGLWRVLSVAWRFTTAAAVADRNVNLIADDQTDVYLDMRSAVDQAAGIAGRYCAYAGATPGGFPLTLINIGLPPEGVVLQPGHSLRSRTVNIQAADTYTLIRALVQEFPFGPDLEWLPTLTTQVEPMG